ncbi:MAG: hypothetical protein KF688_03895 [Pirellulales bacterium]|nr:hypothetical protein [Pirellulales bacterium]
MHIPSPEEDRIGGFVRPGRLCELSPGVEVVAAHAGDHALVLNLLVQIRHADLSEDFQSRLDAPGYSPTDRLLVRRNGQLVAHAQATRHIAWFEGQRAPVVRIDDLVVLPEYAPAGYQLALLRIAEENAVREGATALFSLAADSESFATAGWSRVRGQLHTQARARAVLAHLEAQREQRRRRRRGEPEVRAWRLVDLDAVEALFGRLVPQAWGGLHRTSELWRWLAGRKTHDAILLAVEHDHDRSRGESGQAVGYAVVRDSRVVEMLVDPAHPAARTALLAQACRDAIDRDHHYVSLHTSADDPLHELIVTAGGSWASQSVDGQWMVKLAAPDRWVERLYDVWRERTVAAGIDRPVECAFHVGGETLAVVLTRRSARLEHRGDNPTGAIPCSRAVFHELLLGNLSIGRAERDGLVPRLDPAVARVAATFFPVRHLWQSPWELLRL